MIGWSNAYSTSDQTSVGVEAKTNLLVVTRNLPPLVGGMERLLWHVLDALRSNYNVHVVGPSGCLRTLPEGIQGCEVSSKSIFIFLGLSTIKALWLAFRCRPAIIMAGSGLVAPIVWLVARLVGSQCAVYLHGLDIRAPHIFYQLFWPQFFRRFDNVLVNSHYTRQLALNTGVLSERITIVHPGVTLPCLEDAAERAFSFRSHHHLGQCPVLLFVGRITERKGLACFVEHIFPDIVLALPEAILVIIGGAPVDAIKGGGDEGQRVNNILKANGLVGKALFLGRCSDEDLRNAYFAANVLVFPVQESENDIEGFGMVALEAAAHGLPTVAFSVGGVPDAVSHGRSGRLIPPGLNSDFSRTVIELLTKRSKREHIDKCREFAEPFEWSGFGKKIINLFCNLQ